MLLTTDNKLIVTSVIENVECLIC